MLAELLDSIVQQDRPDLQVIVSDDASPDDTAEIASGFGVKLRDYRFIRQPENIGMDRNFMAAIEAADAEYVWLMGDDDKIEAGGVDRVIEALDRWPDVGGLTLGVIDYDPTMTHQTDVRAMPETQQFHDVATVFSTIAEVLGFMSALVVKRKAWLAIATDPAVRVFENCYVQVYILGRVIEQVGSWGVVKEPCVSFRSGNDQLLDKLGWRKRLEIDVIAYEQIARALLVNDRKAMKAMRARIFDTHVTRRVRTAKDYPGGDRGTVRAALFLAQNYWDMPAFWVKVLPRTLTPSWVIAGGRSAYHRARAALRRPREMARKKVSR
jgi:glycosyltransferase involved in cell wall biosynthesis